MFSVAIQVECQERPAEADKLAATICHGCITGHCGLKMVPVKQKLHLRHDSIEQVQEQERQADEL